MQNSLIIRTAFVSFALIPFFVCPVNAADISTDTVKNDSVQFLYADAKFDSTEATAFFKSSYGYLLNYPKEWERDRRTIDNLVLYLRAEDVKYPAAFREMLTVIREPIEDSSKSLQEYVEMQNEIDVDTWAKYKLDYTVEATHKFILNGMDAYEVKSKLDKVSQKKLLIVFTSNNYAYKIEYTATNVSYNDFLKNVRKVINSFTFVD